MFRYLLLAQLLRALTQETVALSTDQQTKLKPQINWIASSQIQVTESPKSPVHPRTWTNLPAVQQWWSSSDSKTNNNLQIAEFIPSLWGIEGVPSPSIPEPAAGDDHVRFFVYSIGGKMTQVLSASCNKEFPLIPHVGIRIRGTEWFYSDHVESRPSAVMEQMLNIESYPQCQFDLGPTVRSTEEIVDWLVDAQERYNKESYDLWNRNCNHFAKEFAEFLLPGEGIPAPLMNPVIDFTDSMLDNLPNWRRVAGDFFMDKLSRYIVVSWGGVVKKEKERIKEELEAAKSN